jgi:Sulfotransferase family
MRDATFDGDLDRDALLAQATAETGLADFGDDGDPSFPAALDRFAATMAASDLGRPAKVAAYGQLVSVLSWRLRMVADRRRYPAITDERIVAPLFVVGFPRCGTTLLHALLAAGPGHRAPLWWEVARPSPPPSLAEPGDWRIGQANRDMERWLADYPGMLAQHPYHDEGAFASMECEALLAYDLRNAYPMVMPSVPFAPAWADGSDAAAVYRAHHAVLQHLQFGGPRRRWVLKGVEHQYRLGALTAQYPDAMLVWPHRDPAEVFGSLLAVTFEVMRFSGADISNPGAFSEGILDRYVDRVETALKDPVTDSGRVCHVRYRDFVRDQAATIDSIYGHFGLDTTGVEQAVRGWIDDPANRPDRHGKWAYDLADFGVTEDGVRERFRTYIDHFQVLG